MSQSSTNAFHRQTLELFCAIYQRLQTKKSSSILSSQELLLILPSFKLNIRRRSLMFAARLWAMEATRRRVFLVCAEVDGFDDEFEGVRAVRGDESRWDTKLLTWLRGQIAKRWNEKFFEHIFSILHFFLFSNVFHLLEHFLEIIDFLFT